MASLLHWIGLSMDPLAQLVVLALAGYGYYLVLACTSYAVLFTWRRARFHPDHRPNRAEIAASLRLAAVSIAGNALLMMPMHALVASGWSQVYFDVDDHGWPWLLGQIALMLVVTETLVYWIHRALHTDWLYHHVHAFHHRFRVPTPFVGVAFHPLDSFAQAFPLHLCLFLFPIHIGVYTTAVAFITAWAVSIHDRISVTSNPAINYTGHHTLHHWYSDCNYGQFFTLWDRVAGTHRDPERDSEVPAVVLRPNLSRRRR
jgi:lathosterol oxidase